MVLFQIVWVQYQNNDTISLLSGWHGWTQILVPDFKGQNSLDIRAPSVLIVL